jgi:hypothetical protein
MVNTFAEDEEDSSLDTEATTRSSGCPYTIWAPGSAWPFLNLEGELGRSEAHM